jgi:hypothetical protein
MGRRREKEKGLGGVGVKEKRRGGEGGEEEAER